MALALGFGEGDSPDLLSAREIAARRAEIDLVTLAGCSSGTGKAVPGAGLIGLTRAWLQAGTKKVLATHWPVPDDSGELLAAFYSHYARLRAQRHDRWAAASALRYAALEMLHAGSWRSEPRYWSAYFLFSRGLLR
jgi:CHAT domain-containing protein